MPSLGKSLRAAPGLTTCRTPSYTCSGRLQKLIPLSSSAPRRGKIDTPPRRGDGPRDRLFDGDFFFLDGDFLFLDGDFFFLAFDRDLDTFFLSLERDRDLDFFLFFDFDRDLLFDLFFFLDRDRDLEGDFFRLCCDFDRDFERCFDLWHGAGRSGDNAVIRALVADGRGPFELVPFFLERLRLPRERLLRGVGLRFDSTEHADSLLSCRHKSFMRSPVADVLLFSNDEEDARCRSALFSRWECFFAVRAFATAASMRAASFFSRLASSRSFSSSATRAFACSFSRLSREYAPGSHCIRSSVGAT